MVGAENDTPKGLLLNPRFGDWFSAPADAMTPAVSNPSSLFTSQASDNFWDVKFYLEIFTAIT